MLQLWDAATGQPRGAPLQGHTRDVRSVAFSPDGKPSSPAVTTRPCVCGMPPGQPRSAPPKGHTAQVRSIAFAPTVRHSLRQ